MSKYGHRTGDWQEGIINKIGGEEAAERFLRNDLVIVESNHLKRLETIYAKLGEENVERLLRGGEITISEPVRSWREEEKGVITFTLPATDGTTGQGWITRLENKGFRVGKYAKQLLLSPDFKPTTGTVYSVTVLKGEIFSDENRTTTNIRGEAERRGLPKLNAEAACLIRESFSDEELEAMGLIWLTVMHDPIADSVGDPSLLGVNRDVDGRWLSTCYDVPDIRWLRDSGFAFSAQQVS